MLISKFLQDSEEILSEVGTEITNDPQKISVEGLGKNHFRYLRIIKICFDKPTVNIYKVDKCTNINN